MPTPPPPTPRETLLRLLSGSMLMRVVHAAAEIGIPDAIGDGGATAAELAARLGLDERSLARLLRALVGAGLLVEDAGGRCSLTDAGQLLRDGRPGSLRAFARMTGGEEHAGAWAGLVDGIRTGERAFDRRFGKPIFEHLAERPEAAAIFDAAMAGLTAATAEAVATAYDFDRFERIVDVGGGVGTLLAGLLARHRRPRGVVADQPHVLARAERWLDERGLSSRIERAPTDFFVAVPGGGDAYVMKSILHDWDDEKATAILRNTRRAMAPTATLLLVEIVLPARIEPGPAVTAALMDLNMMVMTGGCERTEGEWRALLERGGFRLERVIPTASPSSILEARPA